MWAPHGGEIAWWSDETGNWVFCTPVPGTIIHVEGEDSGDPGDDVISPGGGGTPTPAPWTPAIPPLLEVDTTTDLDTAYFVAYTPEGYRKVLGTEVAGGGSGSLTASNGVQLVGDDLRLDINGLTTTGTITPANDKVALWDDSAGAHRGAFVSTAIRFFMWLPSLSYVLLLPLAEHVLALSDLCPSGMGTLSALSDLADRFAQHPCEYCVFGKSL